MVQVTLDNVTLVGTAHVSRASVNEVAETIERLRPDVVAIELDENRRKALVDKQGFENTPITELLKGGKAGFILAQTLLASHQRRMGSQEGVEPGAEMLQAITSAEKVGARIELVDRDIGVTLRRAYAKMRFGEKLRLSWELMKSVIGLDTLAEDEPSVDEMLEDDVLTAMMEEMAQMAPTVADVLIHERDAYLARGIHEARPQGESVVAVLGAGHLKGVEKHLTTPEAIPAHAPLMLIPTKAFPLSKLIGWALIGSILGVFAWGIYQGFTSGNFQDFLDNVLAYVLITGTLSALGALLAGAHILSIGTAFVAAPFTILHPTLAAGWFSGIVEAGKRTPTVGDFQQVSKIETLKEFWHNGVTRVLLVAALTNLGAMAGAYLAAAYLLGNVFG